jgi:hypothetical protein
MAKKTAGQKFALKNNKRTKTTAAKARKTLAKASLKGKK